MALVKCQGSPRRARTFGLRSVLIIESYRFLNSLYMMQDRDFFEFWPQSTTVCLFHSVSIPSLTCRVLWGPCMGTWHCWVHSTSLEKLCSSISALHLPVRKNLPHLTDKDLRLTVAVIADIAIPPLTKYPAVLHVVSHLILLRAPWGRYYYLHFTLGETEA